MSLNLPYPAFKTWEVGMKNEKGFTLIEVLISMFVLSVGLLGLAALQGTSLRNNFSAYNRSQATMLAYDIADRMRANTGVAPSVYATTAASEKASCFTSSGCSGADMVQNDLFEWNQSIAVILPSGVGEIIGAPGNIYIIRINWDDNRDGCVNPQDNDAAVAGCVGEPDDPNFQMSFET